MNLILFRNYMIFILITSMVTYPMCVFLTATGSSISPDNIHWLKALQYWFLLALPLFTMLFFFLRLVLNMLKHK